MVKEFEDVTLNDTLLALSRLIDEFECGAKHAGIYKLSLMVKAVNYCDIERYVTGHLEYPTVMTHVIQRITVEDYFIKLRKLYADLERIRAELKHKLGLNIV